MAFALPALPALLGGSAVGGAAAAGAGAAATGALGGFAASGAIGASAMTAGITAAIPAAGAAAAGGLSFGTLLSGAGTIFSGINSFMQMGAQEDAMEAKARMETLALRNDIEKSRLQAAEDAKNREEKLRNLLAAQRARLAGKVEQTSGSPVKLQEQLIGSLNREGRYAAIETRNNIVNSQVEKGLVNLELNSGKSALNARRFASASDTLTKGYKAFS